MVLLEEQPSNNRGRDQNEVLPALDMGIVDEMTEFLVSSGGGVDYGKFASKFPKVKKRQLEEHFDIFSLDRGSQRIELPQDHPRRGEVDEEPRSEAGEEEEAPR